jgi:hypothetical protein
MKKEVFKEKRENARIWDSSQRLKMRIGSLRSGSLF